MSTHKHFDKICCVVLALTLILTVLFVNGEYFGIQKISTVMGYEKKLFDTSKVHSINIIMDNWDEFTYNCKSEEYYKCALVIDNEAYNNVAIRGKGNTSLSQVTNDRYSYKIEFDHYDSTKTYYGLDKLCLNNIIQDNTYMKDYLSFQMMNEMGVAASLCSYVYVTVNGEEWGLYLAVEGVEEAFLQRNFGKNYGELYKPDSMNIGGGRGNGEKFNMEELLNDFENESSDDALNSQSQTNEKFPQMPYKNQTDFSAEQPPGAMSPPDIDKNINNNDKENGSSRDIQGNTGMNMLNGSDDVLLKYIDDNAESYKNIFENAKTDITNADKDRLIKALKNLSVAEFLDSTVDVNAVICYFVVHNFVVNFDCYTGSMIHNYYLYEKDGQLQMLPWDYNLAFGGFQSMADAASLVNYPIDSPISAGNISDRPMLSWIFDDEEYKNLYHQYFSEFISNYFDSGYFSELFDNVNGMISPYVEKDPSKFCTYEDFMKGSTTLKEFCLLRAESIKGQLNGTIGSTFDTQNTESLIDAENLQISDMGSMGNTMGDNRKRLQTTDNTTENNSPDNSSSADNSNSDGNIPSQQPRMDAQEDMLQDKFADKQIPKGGQEGPSMGFDNGDFVNQIDFSEGHMQSEGQSSVSKSAWITLCISFLILIPGIIIAFVFKRRR